ncbi:MAG TPA: MFS transporter, partial [Steroidobacteraceae bacterium]|nr:MFS transporter [Steroidobacteraceae bacterium]
LTLINLLNYLDRYLVSGMVPDLKAAPLNLSDAQIGSLTSAFMLVYMIAAPVFGVIGDRGSRTRPIAIGVLIWSLATLVSGFAGSYLHLLGARAMVGVGEAAYVAIAPALLSDSFIQAQRGRVLAVFNMAIPVGAALGYIVAGLISHHYSWRHAFFVGGVPGLLLAFLVLRLKDPPRGSQDENPAEAVGSAASPFAIYAGLFRQLPYMLVVLGYAAYTFALGGLAVWMPNFLERVHGLPAVQATTSFGAIVVVTGFLGTFAGGWLGDYWLKSSRQAYLWMSGGITLVAAPLALLSLTAKAPGVYYPAIVAAELLLFMSTGPINSAISNLVAPAERASAFALSMFFIHLLGDVPSPYLIGVLSDRFSLGSAVLIVPGAIVVSGVVWLICARVCSVRRL